MLRARLARQPALGLAGITLVVPVVVALGWPMRSASRSPRLLYIGLRAYAYAVGWTRAEPEEWIAYAGLNAIGAGVILHVAIGHRWPFVAPEESAAKT